MLADNIFHQPLGWVKPELEATIKNAKKTLEGLSTDLSNKDLLDNLLQDLFLLRGSLEILEFYGAALLVEDMQKAATRLKEPKDKRPEDIYEALLQATLALESYLDKLHKDQTDLPIALLPILNDLRAAIEEPLLSENALFLPNLSIVPKTPEYNEEYENANLLSENARSLRPYYQAALLSWYRNPGDQLSIQQMKLVARNLESTCRTPRNRQIWWILGGLYEALADKGLKSNVAIRLLLGQADRIIKSYCNNEINYYEKTPPFNLLKNALYYISQASSKGERASILKQVYQLDKVMPSEADLTKMRAHLKGPNTETLQAISKELKRTLAMAKSTLENFFRNTPHNTERLNLVVTPLKHVADTLSLLSMSSEKQILQQQISELNAIINSKTRPEKEQLMNIASAIIQVDAGLKHLAGAGKQRITKTSKSVEEDTKMAKDNIKTGFMPESEYRCLVSHAVLEARGNVINVKNNILTFLSSEFADSEAVESSIYLLSEIHGCLQMLDYTYAANVFNSLTQYIRTELQEKAKDDINADLSLLAETIVSLDYYLEALSEERLSSDQFLNLASDCLRQMGQYVEQPKPVVKTPMLEAVVTHISEAPTRLKINANSLSKSIAKHTNEYLANNNSPGKVSEFSPEIPDHEVAEIFIEEAQEELGKMARHISTLEIEHDNQEALSKIYRIYHTLKGSGKIAGAIHISDFSSTIEEYINRVLFGAVQMNQEGITLLSEAYKLLHTLIDCFQKRIAPPLQFNIITEKAIRIMTPESRVENNPTVISTHFPATSPEALPVFEQISNNMIEPESEIIKLLKESFALLNTINTYIREKTDTADLSPMPILILDCINRLYKCAKVTEIREFIQTTELLSRYISNLTRKQAPVNNEILDILSEFCAATHEILLEIPGHLNAEHINPKAFENFSFTDNSLSQFNENVTSIPSTTPLGSNKIVDEKPDEAEQKEDEDDHDIVNIFLDEAEELIARGHTIIQENNFEPGNEKLLAKMQRLLHTLKGSARMAGASSVANLSHAFENLAEAILSKKIQFPLTLEQLFRNTMDAINDMIDDIRADQDIRLHEDLFDEINDLLIPDQENTFASENVTQTIAATEPEKASLTQIQIAPGFRNSVAEKVALNSESALNQVEYLKPVPLEKNEENNATITPEPILPGEAFTYTPPTRTAADKNRPEPVKVSSDVLDDIIDKANSEGAINNRLEDYITTIKNNLFELDKAISRSVNQLRDLQFSSNYTKEEQLPQNSDELNLNQFSETHKATLRMMESIDDIENLHSVITKLTLETDSLLQQQKKNYKEIYELLLSARLVNFSIQTQRIQRIIRQTCQALHKEAKLQMEGTDGYIDRVVLESIMGALEHIIRNAIAHGIESPEIRRALGKNVEGTIQINFHKEESQHVIEIHDDGAGMDLNNIKQKAVEKGLISSGTKLTKEQTLQLIFEPGFSTSSSIDQIAGRGVGMSVVLNDIEALGGSIAIDSNLGEGSTFKIQLPFTVSRNKTLLVSVNKNSYAIPTSAVIQTIPVSQKELQSLYSQVKPIFKFEGHDYPLWHLDSLLNSQPTSLPGKFQNAYLIILKYKHKRLALQVEKINKTRDSVLKPSSPQLSNIKGLAGTTILGNGEVVLILDIPSLFERAETSKNTLNHLIASDSEDKTDTNDIRVLVVDDSITVRKVSERFLNRHNISTKTARDGIEALEIINDYKPDVILLDIEMPHMDGLECAKHLKSDPLLGNIPIIMITSRTGKQHKQIASKIGVDVFLGKPYQETELLGYIQALSGKRLRNE